VCGPNEHALVDVGTLECRVLSANNHTQWSITGRVTTIKASLVWTNSLVEDLRWLHTRLHSPFPASLVFEKKEGVGGGGGEATRRPLSAAASCKHRCGSASVLVVCYMMSLATWQGELLARTHGGGLLGFLLASCRLAVDCATWFHCCVWLPVIQWASSHESTWCFNSLFWHGEGWGEGAQFCLHPRHDLNCIGLFIWQLAHQFTATTTEWWIYDCRVFMDSY
jgi:hypothetical protein